MGYSVQMNRDLPYDTIVQIDESLKTDEMVIDQEGKYGEKSVTFQGGLPVVFSEEDTSAVEQFTSDTIYAEYADLFNNSADGSQIEYGRNGWGWICCLLWL